MKRNVVFVAAADRQLQRLPIYAQRLILEGIRTHLINNDPREKTRNKFQLRRPSEHTDYELRLQNWRVFYRVEEESAQSVKAKITLIGEQQGNRLIIEGEDFLL